MGHVPDSNVRDTEVNRTVDRPYRLSDSQPHRWLRPDWLHDFLARAIDAVADERPGTRVLAVGCGHLPEARFSRALRSLRVGTLYAADYDADSLDVVERTYPRPLVVPIRFELADLLAQKAPLPTADLVYCPTLFESLGERDAIRCAAVLRSLVNKGGRLIIAGRADSAEATRTPTHLFGLVQSVASPADGIELIKSSGGDVAVVRVTAEE